MHPCLALFVVLLTLPAIGYAQAYKCRTPGGKLMISNQGCTNGARLEGIEFSFTILA
jgi:hypothetical protein